MSTDVFYEAEARKRLVSGELFSYAHPVVPVKTGGQSYGSISRYLSAQGIEIPKLALGTVQYRAPYLFVALWSDRNAYTADFIAACASACMHRASHHRLPLFALPLLGGNQGAKFLGAMERGIVEAIDRLDEAEQFVPEYVYVTDKNLGLEGP